jgi:hypothetical protein
MKKLVGFCMIFMAVQAMGQVDTSFVYNTAMPYGTLDIRLAKSATRYYYLQENITFSFRESAPGVKTNTFKKMTSWDTSPYSQGNLREKNGKSDYYIMNYRLLFPKDYNAEYSKGYPLIVMMHGAGERGNCWDTNCHWADRTYKPNTNSPAAPTTSDHSLLNNDHNLLHGGSPHLSARNLAGGKLPDDPTLAARAFPGFVLFGQNLNGWDVGSVQDLIRLVRLMVKKHNIDPDRIYIHGLSNGGSAVYETIKRAPWLFAAALPMSAPSDGGIISKNMIPHVAHIPVWTFQGGQDTSPPPSRTFGYVTKFLAAGMSVRYTLYPNLGHGTWNTAYAEPDFFSWMLLKNKKKLHVFYDIPVICGTTNQGAKMGFSPGFRAYQWQKDGQIINGATGHEYTANSTGIYRARFSRKENPAEADWNEWSDPVTITYSSPNKPVIEVVGTQFMRGPDNNSYYNTVYLKSTPHDKYYWYKNGALVNIPNTSLDDTTQVYRIYASGSTANGTFTVETKGNDNCPSPVSDPVNLYFGNSGPFIDDSNIPTGFSGSAVSNSKVNLSWTDKSSIEKGYEIWRRKPGSIFMLAGKTGPNVTTFQDKNLEPSVAYQYKIRAFTETGRSNYAPGNSLSTNLVITTHSDTQPPTAPSNLSVAGNTISSISLKWSASTDDTGIRRYHVTYGNTTVMTPNNATTFTITDLPSNTAYTISVKAEDLGGNMSSSSSSIVGSTYVTGLTYGHSTGAWTSLDQITTWGTPEFTGTVPNFTLAPRTQEDFFFFEFKGYLYISAGGSYQFRTTSDDGSRLYLNNELLVNNDGLHGNVTVTSATVSLAGGAQNIVVRYFEYTGGQSLTVQYKGPDTGNLWTTIPNSALKSGSAPPVPDGGSTSRIASASTALQEDAALSLYPNPTTADNIFVQFNAVGDAPVEIKMVDVAGKAYYKDIVTASAARNGIRVSPDTRTLNGIYVIIVNQGTNVKKERVVIQN